MRCRLCKADLRDLSRRVQNGMPSDQMYRFEFDHIIPISVALDKKGYKKDYKFVKEILHNRDNIRLLCFGCHKMLTAKLTSALFRKKNVDNGPSLEEKAMVAFRLLVPNHQDTLLVYK